MVSSLKLVPEVVSEVVSKLVLSPVVPSSVAAVVIAVVAGPKVVLVPSAVALCGPEALSPVVLEGSLVVEDALVVPEPVPWSSEVRSLQLVPARPSSTPNTGPATTRCGAPQNGQRVDASNT